MILQLSADCSVLAPQDKSRQLDKAVLEIQQLRAALQRSKTGLQCAPDHSSVCCSMLASRHRLALTGTRCSIPSMASVDARVLHSQGGAENLDVQDLPHCEAKLRGPPVHALLILS